MSVDTNKVLQSISHDILEPLRTIRWYADYFLEQTERVFNEDDAEEIERFHEIVKVAQESFIDFYQSFKESRNLTFYKEYAERILLDHAVDIRTALQNIRLIVRGMRFNSEPDEDVSNEDLRRTTARLAQRCEDLIKFLATSSAPRTRMNLQNEVHRVLDDLRGARLGKSVSLEAVTVQGKIVDDFSRTFIGLIFQNLLANALKFQAPRRPLRLRVSMWSLPKSSLSPLLPKLSASQLQSEVHAKRLHVIAFEDNGIGIRADDLEHIFESGFRSRDAMSIPGSGMGLSIVKDSVKQEGGLVWAKSETGHGSTFFVVLPETDGTRSDLKLASLKELLS